MSKTEPIVAPPEGMRLPDPKSFVPVPLEGWSDGPAAGTVVGMDYDAWAVALVDLTAKPDRVARSRYRMKQNGYQKVEGVVEVIGYRDAEVWVMPRKLYMERIKGKRRRLRERVMRGELSDMALIRPQVKVMGPNGSLITVDE
jgi:hypothetical protein